MSPKTDKTPAPAPMPTTTEPYVTIEEITPALAAEYLKANVRNRRRSEHREAMYTTDMTLGAWVFTGDGIRFGADGELYDGQTRLAAIIRAGTTVRMPVWRNLPRTARLAIDSGRPRDLAARLDMERGGRHGNEVRWLNAIDLVMHRNHRPRTPIEHYALKARYETALAWAAGVFSPGGGNRLQNTPVVGAFVFAYAAAPDAVAVFAGSYLSGANLAADDPALLLRDTVQGARSAESADERRRVFRMVLNAIRAGIRKERRSCIRPNDGDVTFFAKANGET